MNTIMTLEEVSRYLKISKYTIYRMIKDKSIPASRLGGQWRFHKEQIDQWFAKQCITRSQCESAADKVAMALESHEEPLMVD